MADELIDKISKMAMECINEDVNIAVSLTAIVIAHKIGASHILAEVCKSTADDLIDLVEMLDKNQPVN